MGLLSRVFGKTEDKQAELWTEFEGQQNNKTILHEKALALGAPLIHAANSGVNVMEKVIPTLSTHGDTLFLELLIIGLHALDRVAFEQLGSNRRDWFMDPLDSEVVSLLATLKEDEAQAIEFKHTFLDQYADRQQDYACCVLVMNENESSKFGWGDTLAWKLADNLDLERDFAKRFELYIVLSQYFVLLFEGLQLRKLVGN